ncbi:MAG: polysaccharide pyruvyl transferase family protein [Butyrivibrio sp.]|nr:polysaccharide pyruvyl transferase family protein [Butyrivibrio sp.]
MKIGILTYHKSINYGSVLQAWATKDLLERMGHSAEVIDYEPGALKDFYKLYSSGHGVKALARKVVRMPIAKIKKNQQRNFEVFRNRFLNLSSFTLGKNDDFKIIEDSYDWVICGSDQIWNVHAMDSDDIYFLPDVNVKKIALSVSVNNTDFTEPRCNEEMKRWISDFDFLTCREESGAKKIAGFLEGKREVRTFLDPTLMHNKEDFYPLCSGRVIKKPYIFLYKVWSGKDSYKLVSELGKKLNLPVYTMFMHNSMKELCMVESGGVKVIKKDTSPSDYLSLIRYADYVVTDSFHGTAFSLIFEKKFICVREKDTKGRDKNDERILNILHVVGLDDRYIALDSIFTYPISEKIDYSTVTDRRMRIANDNISTLKKVIG